MKSLINRVENISTSATERREANAASANSKGNTRRVARAGKHGVKANLGYFNSDAFNAFLKRLDDSILYKQYKDIIESRKQENKDDAKWRIEVARDIILADFYRKHDDGFRWDPADVVALVKGYKGILIAKARAAKGFNQALYYAVARFFDKRDDGKRPDGTVDRTKKGQLLAVQEFLMVVNAPIIRDHIRL